MNQPASDAGESWISALPPPSSSANLLHYPDPLWHDRCIGPRAPGRRCAASSDWASGVTGGPMSFMEMGRTLGAGPPPPPPRPVLMLRLVRPYGYRDGSYPIAGPQPVNWHDTAFPVVNVEQWTPYAGPI